MLNELRKEIDSIDEKILSLVERRIELVRKVALIKKESRLPILDTKREEEICSEVQKMAKMRGLSAPIMVEMMQLILDYSRIEMGAI